MSLRTCSKERDLAGLPTVDLCDLTVERFVDTCQSDTRYYFRPFHTRDREVFRQVTFRSLSLKPKVIKNVTQDLLRLQNAAYWCTNCCKIKVANCLSARFHLFTFLN